LFEEGVFVAKAEHAGLQRSPPTLYNFSYLFANASRIYFYNCCDDLALAVAPLYSTNSFIS